MDIDPKKRDAILQQMEYEHRMIACMKLEGAVVFGSLSAQELLYPPRRDYDEDLHEEGTCIFNHGNSPRAAFFGAPTNPVSRYIDIYEPDVEQG